MNFTCGLSAGNNSATNTEANADSPTGVHDPYGGTTFTPDPSPNAAGLGIAGMNRLGRTTGLTREKVGMVGWGAVWLVMWGVVGALVVSVV